MRGDIYRTRGSILADLENEISSEIKNKSAEISMAKVDIKQKRKEIKKEKIDVEKKIAQNTLMLSEIQKIRTEIELEIVNLKNVEHKLSTWNFEKQIKLCIGGTLFCTTAETLLFRGYNLFSGIISDKYPSSQDADGNIFIDRDARNFDVILSFLRGNNVAWRISNMEPSEREQFKNDVDFYSVLPLMNMLEPKHVDFVHHRLYVYEKTEKLIIIRAKILMPMINVVLQVDDLTFRLDYDYGDKDLTCCLIGETEFRVLKWTTFHPSNYLGNSEYFDDNGFKMFKIKKPNENEIYEFHFGLR